MRQCPENWQNYWTAPSCEVCPARILWGSFSLQPQGPNCSLGAGESPPHYPSLSTLWCVLAVHTINRNPLSWKNQVCF